MKVSGVRITDNSVKLLTELEKATLAALHAVGLQAVKHMVEQVPYDTGLLRNSLTYALDGEGAQKSNYKADKGAETGSYTGTTPKEGFSKRSIIIGSNVEYAIYQEYGTSKTPAQPYIRPAASNHTDEYKAIIKAYMQGR
jgi:HK97 gp10 family phage protein